MSEARGGANANDARVPVWLKRVGMYAGMLVRVLLARIRSNVACGAQITLLARKDVNQFSDGVCCAAIGTGGTEHTLSDVITTRNEV